MPNTFLLAKVGVVILSFSIVASCVEFHRGTTGVAFNAYVKNNENGDIPGWTTYTLEDLKAMLTVISSKFTRIATFGVGASNVPYEKNLTYQNNTNGQMMAAEATALINREKKGAKNLTMILGIWLSDIAQQTNTEIQVALESAQKANSIAEGTIEGFVFTQLNIHESLGRAKQTLASLRLLRNSTSLKIGSRQPCQGISNGDDDKADEELGMIRKGIVEQSDFIICEVAPGFQNLQSGAEDAFITVRQDLIGFRNEFKKINPQIEVMGQTGVTYKGSQPYQNLELFEKYWRLVDKWGAEQNFTMWMMEAIDNPWKVYALHTGWWRLKQNSLANVTSGYVENIVEPPTDPMSAYAMWSYIGVAVAVIVIIAIMSVATVLYFRVQKLEEILSKEDVKEFMYGLSDEAAAEQVGETGCAPALKFPYDKSYEIPKDKLVIRKEALLGSGQFGYVYKALIDAEGKVEVALKMTKNNCPKTALLSLLTEIKILSYLGKHPNIVAMRGAYTAEISKGIVYVATELCENGSLEDYLRRTPFQGNDACYVNDLNGPKFAYVRAETYSPQTYIILMDLIRWSQEIACGMEYLGEKQVVHADLATRNVLLDANKTAKITDFGLSRRLYDYTNYVKKQQEPLPWRWMAVESLKRLEFSEKSDVWSYGVTLWEIFTLGDLPYPGLNWSLDFVDTLVNGLRMKAPSHATSELYDIMMSCWQTEPEARPSFRDLKLSMAQVLDVIRNNNAD